MLDLRLAWSSSRRDMVRSLSSKFDHRPALLVSYVYLDSFLQSKHLLGYRDWVLDSGAFSVHMAGKTIDVNEYIEACRALKAAHSDLTEVFALDVIGDERASLKNCELSWERGVEAIPCFHQGEPWSFLEHIAKTYPKIALGGIARAREAVKVKWAKQCFARVWPKRIHGFGFGGENGISSLPWDSVDATTWCYRPSCFGQWHTYGWNKGINFSRQFRVEVEWYLELERKCNVKWKAQHELLNSLDGAKA